MNHGTWLNCIISPGQFSEEYAVSGKNHSGNEFSLFVNKQHVEHECHEISKGAECPGRVLVTVLDATTSLTLVRLPGRTFENGSTVTVRNDQLTPEPVPN